MPALEPVAGAPGRRRPRRPRSRAAGPATTSTSSGSRPTRRSGIGATAVDVDDPDAIVEPEAGFVGALLDRVELESLAAHVDWPLPGDAGALAQGKIAGVPAKLLAGDAGAPRDQTRPTPTSSGARLGW